MSSAFSLTTTTCLTAAMRAPFQAHALKAAGPRADGALWEAPSTSACRRPQSERQCSCSTSLQFNLSIQKLMQSLFIQHWKAKRLGLSQLLARVRAGNHARGFYGYRGAHLCARSHEFFFGLLPSESGQCAGERDDLAGERFFSLFCVLSLAFRPMHPGGA